MYRCNNCFAELEQYCDECPQCGYRYGDPPKLDYQLFAGTELKNGRYMIGQVLGSGGFGNIYKAWDTKLEKIVAIKEFYLLGVVNRPLGEKDLIITDKRRAWEFETLRDRFILEARITAQFNSEPDIINVYDYIEENNTAYIVMEFLDGINLSDYMKLNGHFDVEEGVRICLTICSALEKIHSKGIIHRDISPDNIFMCLDGMIKIIDFGAAKLTSKDNLDLVRIVKPGFAPPEQYSKETPEGKWTDVYALGATLYYLITGVVPIESTDRKQTEKDIEKHELPFPHEVSPEIPEYLSNAIMNAMETDTQLRFKDIKQFKAAINKDKIVLAPKEERKRRRRRKYIGLSAAAAVIAAGTAISVYTMRRNIEEETLQPCKMTMWYCKSGDERLDEAEENAYKKIISDFNTSFEDVEIELVGFMPDEYAEKLSSSEQQPNIYEYTDTLSSAARLSLDKVYSSDEMKQCSVLNKAEQTYGNKYQLPLGLDVPVVYANTGLCDYGKDGVSDLSQIMGKVRPEYEPVVFSSKDYDSIFGDTAEYYSESAKEKFLDKNDKICFFGGYTSDYYDVRDKLPVQYKILYCDVDEVPCEYEDVWCANDISKDENRASEKLLGFMLTNNAQDALHVQNQSLSLPVNDAVRDVFVGVHEEFDGTFVNTDKYVFSND